MTKTTFPVNGGAVPKADRAAIMRRAWTIFRSAYGDSPNALKRNRRKASFGYCLLAWQGAKAEAAPKDAVAERFSYLRGTIEIEHMAENWRAARVNIANLQAEI